MQQIVASCQEPDSTELLQVELPLTLRLRRSWSADDIWELHKTCVDNFVSYSDCASPLGLASSNLVKFADDNASTCDDDDVSCLSDETRRGDCSIESVSPRLDWVEEMWECPAPKSRQNPPGIWAIPFESFAIPPGQWTSTLGKLDGPPGKLVGPGNGAAMEKLDAPPGPPGKLGGPPGNVAAPEKLDAPPGNLNAPPGKMTAPPGKLAGIPENLDAPPGQLHAPSTEKIAIPPGKFACPSGKMCVPPGKLRVPQGVAANQIGAPVHDEHFPVLGDNCKRVTRTRFGSCFVGA